MYILIFFIAILALIYLFYNNLEHFEYKDNLKVVSCKGCLDETLKCHPGTIPVCSNKSRTLCYAFYDENGEKRTPCGLYDTFGNVEESCKNCQSYCEYCIGSDGKGRCIGRDIFSCKLCPGNRICKENPFNIYIPKLN